MKFFTHQQNSEKQQKVQLYMVHFSPNYLLFSTPPTPLNGHLGWVGIIMGTRHEKFTLFVTWRFQLNLDCDICNVHTIFSKFIFYKNYFYKIYFYFIFYKIIFYKNYFMLLLEFYKNKILPKDFIKIKIFFFHRDEIK